MQRWTGLSIADLNAPSTLPERRTAKLLSGGLDVSRGGERTARLRRAASAATFAADRVAAIDGDLAGDAARAFDKAMNDVRLTPQELAQGEALYRAWKLQRESRALKRATGVARVFGRRQDNLRAVAARLHETTLADAGVRRAAQIARAAVTNFSTRHPVSVLTGFAVKFVVVMPVVLYAVHRFERKKKRDATTAYVGLPPPGTPAFAPPGPSAGAPLLPG